jgi:hypothetical protein
LEACGKNDNCKICIFRAIEHQLYLAFKNGVFTYWVLTDEVIVIQRPKIREENNRLHSEVGPAIEWKDEAYHYLNGVRFGKELWAKVVAGGMTFKEILGIQNTEQRLQAMRYNPNALMNEKPKLVHATERDNQLYLIENSEVNKLYDEKKVWLLRFRDPSKLPPNNWMIEEVDPKVAEVSPDADVIQAYHLGLTYPEYQSLKLES